MYAFKKAFAMPLILKINHAVHQRCYYSLTFTCAVLDIHYLFCCYGIMRDLQTIVKRPDHQILDSIVFWTCFLPISTVFVFLFGKNCRRPPWFEQKLKNYVENWQCSLKNWFLNYFKVKYIELCNFEGQRQVLRDNISDWRANLTSFGRNIRLFCL